MDKEQLAKWNADQASAAQATASSQEPPTRFYTGKPYVSYAGGYIHEYRTYNPEMSRWTSADPSGFPDGPNAELYAAVPTTQLDPKGLTSETVGSQTVTVTGIPSSNETGTRLSITVTNPAAPSPGLVEGTMQVNWSISGNVSGWIIQHITFTGTIYNNSDNSPVPYTNTNYYEAWQVTNGVVQFGGEDDFDTSVQSSSTHGEITISGNVTFFQTSTVGTGSDNPTNWASGGAPQAGDLNSTTTAPSYWSDTDTYTHSLDLNWE